jgi:hypothetical protein
MKTLETQSMSRSTAGCNPIVLREGEQVRLVFVPILVDNPANPKASVDGYFIYQRKAKSGRWIPVPTVPLSALKAGEGFKLTLHAHELRVLLEGLVPLYKFYEQQGIPRGHKTFVEVDQGLAKFVSLGQKDLTILLESRPDDAAVMLLRLVKWLATSAGRRQTAEKLVSQAPEQMPAFTALLGIAAVKDALGYWKQNRRIDSEDFWQRSLTDRSYVLGQVFAYPVVVIGSKAYVGGKQVSSRGGKEVDFLLATESTDAVILIEIKTPQTKLLGSVYRDNVFPLSRELASAVAQVLRYRQSLMRRFDSITAETSQRLTLGEPRCVVIAGDSAELSNQNMKENFELQRERIQGVTVITYDELFLRLERLVTLLEEPF